ncbi:hypothetical protein Clacol_007978 [Clathrus columnatus]|uniref:Uncharacterized protein n=1 Tax=Clathrus columnatus TaxID=1419009 RepID=A0AAV5AJ54_9AGAM|nr:hypothetical protein Clacol_007978 [Clathrus columnatus]
MSYSPIQAPIIADDDEMTRLLEQMFGSAPVASNAAVSGPSLQQTAAVTESDANPVEDDANAWYAVEPMNGVEEKENDASENVDVVKEQIVITLPEQDTQTPNDDDNVLQTLENIHTDNSIFSSSGDMGINYQFPTSGSENVNDQTAMHGNVNSGINYEEADFQVDTMSFDMIRYALALQEPNDSTSYMGNYYFPDDENVVGDVDNSLSFPTPTQSTHPVAERSDFGSTGVVQNNNNNVGSLLFPPPNPALMPLMAPQYAVIQNHHDPVPITTNENPVDPGQTQAIGDYDNSLLPFPSPTRSNHLAAEGCFLESNSDVENNDNNNAVAGDSSQIPVAYNDTPTLQGSGGFFILPYYDPSTGQISHVPFSIPIPNPAAGDHYPIPITQAVGAGEHSEDENNSSLCSPPLMQSSHPVVEGNSSKNNGTVQNNTDHNTVVGDDSQLPVTHNNDLPQAPTSVQGSGGFFLLPYYDPSTGQTTQVPFPVSALQGMAQSTTLHPTQPNEPRVANSSFNTGAQQPEFVQGNSQGSSIPADMGLLDYTNLIMNFGASEMSGGVPIPNITNSPLVNLDWSQPIPSSSFHVPPIVGSKRPLNEDTDTTSRPRKCRYRGHVKPPAYPHPHSLEQRKSAPPYVKIGQKHVFLCNYIGPAEVNSSRIYGEPLMTGKRNCLRHIAKHAEREEKMIQAGVLKLEEAHALFWVEKISFKCPHCNYQEFVWRTDGVRAKHEAEFHPDIFANRPKVVRKKKGKEKEGTGTGKKKKNGKGKGKGKEREEGINDENA